MLSAVVGFSGVIFKLSIEGKCASDLVVNKNDSKNPKSVS